MEKAVRNVPSPAGERVLPRALLRAARLLGLRHADLARVIGTSPSSVSRMARGRTLDPESKEGELALLFLRMFRSLDALVGGDGERARAWLHAENRHLRAVPAERIATVEGLVDTVRYLDALRGRN